MEENFDWKTLKYNPNKTIELRAGSVGSFRICDVMGSLGYNKEKSDFLIKGYPYGDSQLIKGEVVFENGCRVIIKE